MICTRAQSQSQFFSWSPFQTFGGKFQVAMLLIKAYPKAKRMSKAKLKTKGQQGSKGSGRLEAKRERLAQEIEFWASEKMRLKKTSIPAPEELKL